MSAAPRGRAARPRRGRRRRKPQGDGARRSRRTAAASRSSATPPRALARAIDDPSVGLVVTDLKMPGKTGLELATDLAAARPDVSVLLVTAFGDVETLLAGARPRHRRLRRQAGREGRPAPPRRGRAPACAAGGRDPATSASGSTSATASRRSSAISRPMERLFERLRVVAPTKTTVLIIGESGTGKELVANALHHNSPRRPRAFVALNCGAIPKEIIESELFGHEKGAFTGALVKRIGRIEQAHGGTLFLDEVSEMPPDLQVKFLRVLEERRVTPVGGNESKDVDFRLVAATNRDLAKEIEVGPLPAGPLLPPLGRRRRDPAAPRAARRHPAPRRALPRRLRARARAGRSPA